MKLYPTVTAHPKCLKQEENGEMKSIGENYRHMLAHMHNSEMFIIKFQWSQLHSPERLC